ncbi:unnamed protein product [Symbiodinium sp. CCMP2592]|nr:unnamed protein product [Symbiodinium sp. CCMP2592]
MPSLPRSAAADEPSFDALRNGSEVRELHVLRNSKDRLLGVSELGVTPDPWSSGGTEKKHCSRSRPRSQKRIGAVWGVWHQTGRARRSVNVLWKMIAFARGALGCGMLDQSGPLF